MDKVLSNFHKELGARSAAADEADKEFAEKLAARGKPIPAAVLESKTETKAIASESRRVVKGISSYEEKVPALKTDTLSQSAQLALIDSADDPSMAQRVPSLADLCAYRLAHFSQHHKIDLDSFAALPEELLQRIMKMLRTSPSFRMSDASLLPFVQPSIRSFSVHVVREEHANIDDIEPPQSLITPALLDAVVLRCPHITDLDLGGYHQRLTRSQLEGLSKLPLTALGLSQSKLSVAELALLTRSPKLARVDMRWAMALKYKEGPSFVLGLCYALRNSLTHLVVDGIRMDPDLLLTQCLQLCPLLQELSMEACAEGDFEVEETKSDALDSEIRKLQEQNDELRKAIEAHSLALSSETKSPPGGAPLSASTSDTLLAAFDSAASAAVSGAPGARLTSLTAVGCEGLTPDALALITKQCPQLQRLNLKGVSSSLSDKFAAELIRACPQLTELSMADCQHISNATLTGLAEGLPSLRSIDLSWCDSLGDAAIGQMFDSMNSLTKVGLNVCEEVSGATVAKLARHKDLRSLELSRCSHVPGAVLAASARNWASLTRLNVCWLPIDNKQAQAILDHCPLLGVLELEGCKAITDVVPFYMAEKTSSRCFLSFINFFYVDVVSLEAIELLVRSSLHAGIAVRDYYGTVHTKESVGPAEPKKAAGGSGGGESAAAADGDSKESKRESKRA